MSCYLDLCFTTFQQIHIYFERCSTNFNLQFNAVTAKVTLRNTLLNILYPISTSLYQLLNHPKSQFPKNDAA